MSINFTFEALFDKPVGLHPDFLVERISRFLDIELVRVSHDKESIAVFRVVTDDPAVSLARISG